MLHGDDRSESFLTETPDSMAVNGGRQPNAESIYEYGSRAGFWRLFRMFAERSVPVPVTGSLVSVFGFGFGFGFTFTVCGCKFVCVCVFVS